MYRNFFLHFLGDQYSFSSSSSFYVSPISPLSTSGGKKIDASPPPKKSQPSSRAFPTHIFFYSPSLFPDRDAEGLFLPPRTDGRKMEKIWEGRVSGGPKKTIYTVSYVYCAQGLTTDGSHAFFVEMLAGSSCFFFPFFGGVQLPCNRV